MSSKLEAFLTSRGFGRYYKTLMANEVDEKIFPALTVDDFLEMEIQEVDADALFRISPVQSNGTIS